MKKKLIDLGVEDINAANIYSILNSLESIDTSDFGCDREDEFSNLMDSCQHAIEVLENNNFEDLRDNFLSLREKLVTLVQEVGNPESLEDMRDYCENLKDTLEDIDSLLTDEDDENFEDCLQDLVDAIVEYQDNYGGLGRIYID